MGTKMTITFSAFVLIMTTMVVEFQVSVGGEAVVDITITKEFKSSINIDETFQHNSNNKHYHKNSWLKEEYPNLFTSDVCKSTSTKFCDPDDILTEEDKVQLQTILEQNRTFNFICDDDNKEEDKFNIPIAVALLRKMDPTLLGQFEDRPDIGIQEFAQYIYQIWSKDTTTMLQQQTTATSNNNNDYNYCKGASVLIVISIDDRVVYFARGGPLYTILTERRVQRLLEIMKPMLEKDNYVRAITDAIEGINFYIQYGKPHFWETFNDSCWPEFCCFIWTGISFICMYRIFCHEHKAYKKQSMGNYRQQIQFDKVLGEMMYNRYRTSSCSICLCNFSIDETIIRNNLHNNTTKHSCSSTYVYNKKQMIIGSDGMEVTILRCGHAFDTSCWKLWYRQCLITKQYCVVTCPLCNSQAERWPERRQISTNEEDIPIVLQFFLG